MVYDASTWTGRRTNPWWQIGFHTTRLAARLGWCPMRNRFGIEVLAGAVRNPGEGNSRYRWAWSMWFA